ncbi:PKD domain-containing protein [Haloarchaeobius sp. DT45]|uniref:PKD domain-containing protein n=1 Tax=Haloarchaeobius sp. DT45 TaxID=3446116 RepID=UPI003F6C1158
MNQSDTSHDPTTPTSLSVAYNATGEVGSPSDLLVRVVNASSGNAVAGNATLGTTIGTADVTISSNTFDSTQGVRYELVNNSNGNVLASDTSVLGVSGGGGGSNTVTESFTIVDSSPTTHQNVTVDVVLNNTGSSTETKQVNIYYDGSKFPRVSESVQVPQGEHTFSFNASFATDGSHTLKVNGLSAKPLTVSKTPVEVQSQSFSASRVDPGEPVSFSVALQNTAGSSAERLVAIQKDGSYQTVQETSTTVAGSSTGTVTFATAFTTPGGHTLSAKSAFSEDANVVVNDSELSIDSISVPSSTYTRQKTDIDVTVSNTNASSKSYSIAVLATKDGKTRALNVTTVTVPGSSTQTFTLKADKIYNTGDWSVTANDFGSPQTLSVQNPLSVTGVHSSPTPIQKGDTVTVNVTYQNPTASSHQTFSYLSVYSERGGSLPFQNKQVTIPASTTKNVSYTFTAANAGVYHLHTSQQTSARLVVLNDTTGTPNVGVERLFTPDTAVNDTDAFFGVVLNNTGDADDVVNVSLDIGGTTVTEKQTYVAGSGFGRTFLTHNFSTTGTKSGFVNVTDPTTETVLISKSVAIDVRGPVVVDGSTSIEHVGGTAPSQNPSVKATYSGGHIGFQISDSTGSFPTMNLTGLGVDSTTEFRINLTVDNYDPRVLVSNGRGLTWNTQPGQNAGETNVSILVRPAQLDYKSNFSNGYPRSPSEWEEKVQNDSANFGWQHAIMLGIGDATMAADASGASAQNLTNMTVSTDAQLFSMPRYDPGGSNTDPQLNIPLAAPHETVNGNTNDGYYDAYLPDSLLNEWGVTNPQSELAAEFSENSTTNFDVTEVSGGVYVNVSLHYSSGTLTIQPSSSGSESGSGSGSGSGSESGSDGGSADTTPPNAALSAPTSATVGDSLSFDGSASTDDTGVTSYEWDFDGDGSYETTGETASHTFESTGTYTVTLRVSDAAGYTATESVSVTVTADDETDDSAQTTQTATATATATQTATATATATPTATATATPTATATDAPAGDDTATATATDATQAGGDDDSSGGSMPGFGPATGLLALLAAVALLARRS